MGGGSETQVAGKWHAGHAVLIHTVAPQPLSPFTSHRYGIRSEAFSLFYHDAALNPDVLSHTARLVSDQPRVTRSVAPRGPASVPLGPALAASGLHACAWWSGLGLQASSGSTSACISYTLAQWVTRRIKYIG